VNLLEVSDVAVLAGMSAAFIFLKNVRKKREKYRRSIWVKDYLESRRHRLHPHHFFFLSLFGAPLQNKIVDF